MSKLNIRFCKQILGIHSKSSNHACRAELGRVHFAYNIYCNVIKYWNRLCSINEDCLGNPRRHKGGGGQSPPPLDFFGLKVLFLDPLPKALAKLFFVR